MHTKVCPRCGYHGWEVQPAASDEVRADVFECPSCGGDLYARPPRSYAEMEGLAELPGSQRLAGVMPASESGCRSSGGLVGRVLRFLGCLLGMRRSD